MLMRNWKRNLMAVLVSGGFLIAPGGSAFADVPQFLDAPGITEAMIPEYFAVRSFQTVDEASGKVLVQGKFPELKLTTTQVGEGIFNGLAEINKQSKKKAIEVVKNLTQTAKEDLSNNALREQMPYQYFCDASIVMGNQQGLSVLFNHYMNAGGAHPSYSYSAENLDKNGNPLTVKDICNDVPQLCQAIKNEIIRIGYDRYCFDVEKSFADFADKDGAGLVFVRNGESVYFYFSPYVIAPYASGYSIIELKYADYPQLLNQI